MFYISKGIVYKESNKNDVTVSRCGSDYNLLGEQAKLWLAGQFKAAYTENLAEQTKLRELESMGLIETAEPEDTAQFRLLTNCVICSVTRIFSYSLLNKTEKLIWQWIKNAGFKLTISELVYLTEKNIIPKPIYFGKDNWHTLIHAIYNKETIFDGILDAKMAESTARNETVSAVLGLLKKRYIILV